MILNIHPFTNTLQRRITTRRREFYNRSHKSPLSTIEPTMNLTYQTVMRSCYKPGKKKTDCGRITATNIKLINMFVAVIRKNEKLKKTQKANEIFNLVLFSFAPV